MFIVLRIDTTNYAFVVSSHHTLEKADSVIAQKTKHYPKGTAAHLMYAVREFAQKVKKGNRVRFNPDRAVLLPL